MLLTKRVLENIQSPSGYNVCLLYEFETDSVKIHLKGVSEGDAEVFLIDKEAEVTATMQQKHALQAFSSNLTSEFKEAPESLVKYQYLRAGLLESEPYKAYELMVKVAPDILSLGLTVEQMAQMFGETIENAQATLDKWTHLDTNKDIITAYRGL